jgi:hypothetical protein
MQDSNSERAGVAHFFHTYVTPLRFAVCYGLCAIFLLGVILPALNVARRDKNQAKREKLSAIAGRLSADFDIELSHMHSALKLARGFAASGAPLRVADYFHDNASTRSAVALTVGTPTALSQDAYSRIMTTAATMFKGFYNAAVRPGLVNTFTAVDYLMNQDLLWNVSTEFTASYFYIVSHAQTVIIGPESAAANDSAVVISIRAPIFNRLDNLSTDPDAVDPVTGQHPNWKNLWGATSILMDLAAYGVQSNLTGTVGSENDFLFHAVPSAPSGNKIFDSDARIFLNSTEPGFFSDAVANCADTPGFRHICFRVKPKAGWESDDRGVLLGVGALLIVFCTLIVMLLVLAVLRLVAGPRPDLFKYAPTAPPFHACCVDMMQTNAMWAEVPFLMNEVATTLAGQLRKCAKECKVFIAVRFGNTAIAISAERKNVVDFARAMQRWTRTFEWPAHIAAHLSGNIHVAFSFVLHTNERGAIRFDRANNHCEIQGSFVQTMMMLRLAAIAGHIICTGKFLGDQPALTKRRGILPSASRTVDMSDDTVSTNPLGSRPDEVMQYLDAVHPLGVCDVPTHNEKHPILVVRGFLVQSDATQGKPLSAVVDALPETVWNEWHAANVHEDEQVAAARQRNSAYPLGMGESYNTSIVNSVARGSMSTMMRVSTSVSLLNRAIAMIHLQNGEASATLPGSATNMMEVRQLAESLVPLILSMRKQFDPSNSITVSASITTSLTNNNPAVAQFRRALSLASYFYVAYQTAFAPIDAPSRQTILAKACAAGGTPSDDYVYILSARCARFTLPNLDDAHPSDHKKSDSG